MLHCRRCGASNPIPSFRRRRAFGKYTYVQFLCHSCDGACGAWYAANFACLEKQAIRKLSANKDSTAAKRVRYTLRNLLKGIPRT